MPNTRGLVLEGDPWPSYFNPFSFTNCAKSVFGWVSSKNHLYSDLGLGRAHPNFPQRNPSRLILALLRFQTEPFHTWKQKENKHIFILNRGSGGAPRFSKFYSKLHSGLMGTPKFSKLYSKLHSSLIFHRGTFPDMETSWTIVESQVLQFSSLKALKANSKQLL